MDQNFSVIKLPTTLASIVRHKKRRYSIVFMCYFAFIQFTYAGISSDSLINLNSALLFTSMAQHTPAPEIHSGGLPIQSMTEWLFIYGFFLIHMGVFGFVMAYCSGFTLFDNFLFSGLL